MRSRESSANRGTPGRGKIRDVGQFGNVWLVDANAQPDVGNEARSRSDQMNEDCSSNLTDAHCSAKEVERGDERNPALGEGGAGICAYYSLLIANGADCRS
jgi:hypothetical protein